jgi:hypothetical protein
LSISIFPAGYGFGFSPGRHLLLSGSQQGFADPIQGFRKCAPGAGYVYPLEASSAVSENLSAVQPQLGLVDNTVLQFLYA